MLTSDAGSREVVGLAVGKRDESGANTPIDYLEFASPISGLGGKMGLDATNKWQGETQ